MSPLLLLLLLLLPRLVLLLLLLLLRSLLRARRVLISPSPSLYSHAAVVAAAVGTVAPTTHDDAITLSLCVRLGPGPGLGLSVLLQPAGFVLLVSGLQVGGKHDPLLVSLLVDFVAGYLGGAEDQEGTSARCAFGGADRAIQG